MQFQWVVPIMVLAAGAQAAACDAQVSEVRTDHGSVSWELPIGEEVRPPVDGCALEALADRVAQIAAAGGDLVVSITGHFRRTGSPSLALARVSLVAGDLQTKVLRRIGRLRLPIDARLLGDQESGAGSGLLGRVVLRVHRRNGS